MCTVLSCFHALFMPSLLLPTSLLALFFHRSPVHVAVSDSQALGLVMVCTRRGTSVGRERLSCLSECAHVTCVCVSGEEFFPEILGLLATQY